MKVSDPNSKPASDAQTRFLAILLDDTGRDTMAKRNDWCSGRVNREIKFLDELTMREASALIQELKDEKEEDCRMDDDNLQEDPFWD